MTFAALGELIANMTDEQRASEPLVYIPGSDDDRDSGQLFVLETTVFGIRSELPEQIGSAFADDHPVILVEG